MPTEVEPLEGNWYYDRDKDRRFEVIAVDEQDNRIDIQDFDGDLDEITFEYWFSLSVEPAEPPEEWLGPMDSAEEEDLDYNDQTLGPENRPSPLGRYRREQVEWAGKAHKPYAGKGERRRTPRSSR